ncbi:cytochrome P450 [Aspergillus avenaceus]|uniref:Cytochrome P450 n=1 Tax=Aspergillus avenaceus TaxID=36643 RepID=A0A5N6TXV1_ASPAV|nr:cytochrome P450 [Aspergillus avenaceus]
MSEWFHFIAYEHIWKMMAQVVTAYVIHSDRLCNPDYAQFCRDFCDQVGKFRDLRGRFPETLWPLVRRFSRCGRTLQSTIASCKSILTPEIRRRIAYAQANQCPKDSHTLVDATIELKIMKGEIGFHTPLANEGEVINGIAGDCLLAVFEAAFPITVYVIGMMNYAISHPDYADTLRNEVLSALSSTGGEWPVEILDRMPRLEAFARETARCDLTSIFTATRRLLKPVYFESIGRTLARNTSVTLPVNCYHQNPDFYPNPGTFEACRFYNSEANTCEPRAATVNSSFLSFGCGAEMCPGRAFGMRQVQLTFAKILISFDFDSYPMKGVKMSNGVSGPAATLNQDIIFQWRRRSFRRSGLRM